MPAAAQPAGPEQDQALAHAVYYAASQCAIKDDVIQLAACWKSGSGPLPKQEAGLLLWHHTSRGEDGLAEVLAAGVVVPCLDVLDSTSALPADKSTAAGLLLSLCADDKGREQVAKSKASGATGSSCCQVLHGCLASPSTTPRHVTSVLSSLASSSVSLPVLMRALAGDPPWPMYAGLLAHSHQRAKDHTTAIDTAALIQNLVSGRPALATAAAAAGVLQALLTAASAHKSAAAVCAVTSCLLQLCLAAPELCEQFGQLPGAMQSVADLLGPPPASVLAWEQQQLKQQHPLPSPHLQSSPAASSTATASDSDLQQQQHFGKPASQANSSMRPAAGSNTGSGQHVRLGDVTSDSMTAGGRSSALGSTGGAEAEGGAREMPQDEQGSGRTRRKSLRILSVAEGEAATQAVAAASVADTVGSPTLRSRSVLGCIKHGTAGCKSSICMRGGTGASSSSSSTPMYWPPLGINSTALKWEGPVPDATRAAAAGLLAQLVQLPQLCEAASRRLSASRLAALLVSGVAPLLEASGKKGKAASKFSLTPEAEALLTHACVGLEFLVASHNADCYRVAAAGCLPGLVQLATHSRNTRLRRAAQAVIAQVALLAEAQPYMQQAAVPEDMVAVCGPPRGPHVLMKLTDVEVRQLLVEFPSGAALAALDDVTARARA